MNFLCLRVLNMEESIKDWMKMCFCRVSREIVCMLSFMALMVSS